MSVLKHFSMVILYLFVQDLRYENGNISCKLESVVMFWKLINIQIIIYAYQELINPLNHESLPFNH